MSFRFTVSLFEADRDAGSPDAADITAILRKSEREPEPMSVEVNVPRWRMTFPVPDRFTARTFFQWLHFILPFVGLVAWLALSNLARRRDTPDHKKM